MDRGREEIIKLTSLSSKAGWGCKLSPSDLTQVLSQVKTHPKDQRVMFSQNSSDDAGVYKLSDHLALIQTIDYFTPIVDDPYMFGQIAAANALSDVYAMGGEVITALNIVGFSVSKYGANNLAKILQGAEDKVHEAGGAIIGGHSIDDDEPKFGLAVTGIAHPNEIFINNNAKENDALVLTKPLGIGIISTAIKRDLANEAMTDEAIYWMSLLNKEAANLLKKYNVNSVTDVTGFGLLGHALEMAKGSEKSLIINYNSVPIINGTIALAKKGIIPGGSKANFKWIENDVQFIVELEQYEKLILADAITSGGLLISMPKEEAVNYVQKLNSLNDMYQAKIIGEVTQKQQNYIYVK